MTNVEMKVDGNKLIITADLSKDFGPSKSGKTIIIATTGGNVSAPGNEAMKFALKPCCSQGHNPQVHVLRKDMDLKDNQTLCGIMVNRSWEDTHGPATCKRCLKIL